MPCLSIDKINLADAALWLTTEELEDIEALEGVPMTRSEIEELILDLEFKRRKRLGLPRFLSVEDTNALLGPSTPEELEQASAEWAEFNEITAKFPPTAMRGAV
jgi:hypothetical protein